MTNLLKRVQSKKVILWGVGAIQMDVEALFPELQIAYYIDDRLEEKGNRILPCLQEKSKTSDCLLNEEKDKVFIIVCEQNFTDIDLKLAQLGYEQGTQYIKYDRLLYEYPIEQFIERYWNNQVVVWGCGKSYEDYREVVEKHTQGIAFIIDGEADEIRTQDGYQVYSKKRAFEIFDNMPVIVASTYYPIICQKLEAVGLKKGEDTLFCDTFFQLCRYAILKSVEYSFEDRQRGSSHLLMVLAGYDEKNWDEVCRRIISYTPSFYDVCILSSGLKSDKLSQQCAENGWSYLSTKENKISAIQNLAIHLHRNAEWIAKMDEDIYLTEGTFEVLEDTYLEVEKKSRYLVGFVSPLIQVNTYGYVRILDITGKRDEWEQRFEKVKITDGLNHHLRITEEPRAVEYLWSIFDIDAYSKEHRGKEITYSICPARYSIGMIFYKKETWIDMKFFPDAKGNNLGMDEEWFCNYCMMHAKAIVVAENVAVGHLGYKEQKKKR